MNADKLKAWYHASRPPFFVATLIPLVLGARIAALEDHFSGLLFTVTLLASFFVHLNTNLANDYFEFENDSRDISIGGSRGLQNGLITMREMKRAIILLYILAFCGGAYILYTTRCFTILWLSFFAFLSSLFYTAPPLRLGYRGLGELTVGLNMGPIMVFGTYLVMNPHYSSKAMLLSLPLGIMVAMILFYQSFSDMAADEEIGKRTLALHLGRKGAIALFNIAAASVYLLIMYFVNRGILNYTALAAVITLPFISRTTQLLIKNDDWVPLHEKGHLVRFYYLANGLILILTIR